MVMIRDPICRNTATGQVLQQLFGLTNAEAHLAEALCTGGRPVHMLSSAG